MNKFKKEILIIVLFSFIVLLSSWGVSRFSEYREHVEYKNSVASFQNVKVKEIEEMQMKGEDFYLYTGRETCPYCREFAPLLKDYAENHNLKIYYLNSEQYKTDVELIKFRETYEIPTVPSLIHFKGKEKVYEIDASSEISSIY